MSHTYGDDPVRRIWELEQEVLLLTEKLRIAKFEAEGQRLRAKAFAFQLSQMGDLDGWNPV